MNSILIDQNFTTFEPEGYISAANSNEFLKKLISVIESSSDSALLIDMEKVEFMDSAGLMALIEAFRIAKDMQRSISICSVAPPVRMLFELTQLDNVFNIVESQEDLGLSTPAMAA